VHRTVDYTVGFLMKNRRAPAGTGCTGTPAGGSGPTAQGYHDSTMCDVRLDRNTPSTEQSLAGSTLGHAAVWDGCPIESTVEVMT
jgi:hypothetical protein